jgi:hypothetical protein
MWAVRLPSPTAPAPSAATTAPTIGSERVHGHRRGCRRTPRA